MAGINQIKISELPTKEAPSTNDYLVMDDGSETSRIKADAINEPLQQQVNAVNTKLGKKVPKTHVLNNVDLNSIIESGFYRIGEGVANMPPTDDNPFMYCQMLVISGGGDTVCQMVFPYWTSDFFYIRNGNFFGGITNFKPWAKYKASSL